MNSSNAKDYLPLVQALADGKVIQMLDGHGYWVDIAEISSEVDACLYRIKPEPKEVWVNRWPDGMQSDVNYPTKENASIYDHTGGRAIQVRYREVIE